MPGIIDSAPDCVTHAAGSENARVDDAADFILQADYDKCAGFMTFGSGSTYGPEGTSADTAYYILTWLGIGATIVILIAWIVYEHRELVAEALRLGRGRGESA